LDGLVEYVMKSSYRTRVLQAIGDEVMMPHQIARKSNVLNNHISKTLRQLREHDLVELINPEVSRGRLYRLTDEGKIILNEIRCE
jgi:predicted transcriptional regulator